MANGGLFINNILSYYSEESYELTSFTFTPSFVSEYIKLSGEIIGNLEAPDQEEDRYLEEADILVNSCLEMLNLFE